MIAAMEKAVVPLAASDSADAALVSLNGPSIEPVVISPVPGSTNESPSGLP